MKKKISLLICMLVAVLSFTGCSSTKTEVEYDEAEVEQVTEFLIGYCVEMDDATLEQWQNMTDFALEQQLTSRTSIYAGKLPGSTGKLGSRC